MTGGLIPGTSGFGKTNIGLPAVEAWATAIGVYLLAMLVARRVSAGRGRCSSACLPPRRPRSQPKPG